MSTDFTRENPTLSAKIAAAKSPDELRDILIEYQQANGLPNATDRVALPSRSGDSSSSAPVESAGGSGNFYEVLYPHNNDRIEISADTQEEFDRRKAAVLAAYGKK